MITTSPVTWPHLRHGRPCSFTSPRPRAPAGAPARVLARGHPQREPPAGPGRRATAAQRRGPQLRGPGLGAHLVSATLPGRPRLPVRYQWPGHRGAERRRGDRHRPGWRAVTRTVRRLARGDRPSPERLRTQRPHRRVARRGVICLAVALVQIRVDHLGSPGRVRVWPRDPVAAHKLARDAAFREQLGAMTVLGRLAAPGPDRRP